MEFYHFGSTFTKIASKHGVHNIAAGHQQRTMSRTAAIIQQEVNVSVETLIEAEF